MENTERKENIAPRPPVVCVMGHIDHGKSTLLDYIRKTKVAEKEAGGITQHIGAYELKTKDKEGTERRMTFLDTPGHEAFASLRERGVTVANVAVLVVSAEEGVKTQTLEALKFIKEAEIPFIVAMTKIDKPNANAESTKQNLAENEIYLEGYGGTIPAVAVSSKTGEGMPELLEMISLISDMEGAVGDFSKPAEGYVIEAFMDKAKGISATLITTDGTLKSGMTIVAENALSPTRIMEDSDGKRITEASFSSPIVVVGWNKLPKVGSRFLSFEKKKDAEEAAGKVKDLPKENRQENRPTQAADSEKPTVPLVIKTDVIGTLEAIKHEIAKIKSDRIIIRTILEGVGDIGESDIKIASAKKDSVIIGFNVDTSASAKGLAERLGITVFNFDIIYKMTEWLQELIVSRTPKILVPEISGEAKVQKIFSKEKDRQIVGGKVASGTIALGDEVKIMRRENEIGSGTIKDLQQQKQKTKSVESGREFGALIQSSIEIAPGDRIASFTMVEK